jgi:hypothetical protein
MVYFFDSSALVKAYVQENGSAWVLQLCALAARDRIYLASVTGVEVISALVRKRKSGGFADVDLTIALGKFRSDFVRNFSRLDVSDRLIQIAMQLAETHALRGYDAVQLAAARTIWQQRALMGQSVLIFVSADAALNTAASVEGLLADDPNAYP